MAALFCAALLISLFTIVLLLDRIPLARLLHAVRLRAAPAARCVPPEMTADQMGAGGGIEWRQLALFYAAVTRVRQGHTDVLAAAATEHAAEPLRMMAELVTEVREGYERPQCRLATHLSVSAAVAAAAITARPTSKHVGCCL